jgi:hypothetical protein
MSAVRITLFVIACLVLIGSAGLIAQVAATAPKTPAVSACPTVYSMTKTVQFCGALDTQCQGHQYPNEITIVPDADASAQVVGVWVLPDGAIATSGIDNFHAIGSPDAVNGNTAVIRFIHPTALQRTVFNYTVIVKYMKGAAPKGT